MTATKTYKARQTLQYSSCLIEVGPKSEPMDLRTFLSKLPLDDDSEPEKTINHIIKRITEISRDMIYLDWVVLYYQPFFVSHPLFYYHPHNIIEITTQKNELDPRNIHMEEHVNTYINVLSSAFDSFKPVCMWAGLWIDYHWDIAEVLHKLPHERVYGAAFYGKGMVDLIGRERLLSAPVWRVDERPWGGIVLQLEENPFNLENKELPEKVIKYLDLQNIDFTSVSHYFKWEGYKEGEYRWG